jgi:hypothetical protein
MESSGEKRLGEGDVKPMEFLFGVGKRTTKYNFEIFIRQLYTNT